MHPLNTVISTGALLLAASAAAQTPAVNSSGGPLLDEMVGSWVLTGTIGGQQTTHDVDAAWVLGRGYVRLHEVSREKDATGAPAYEAIVFISWDPKTAQYACLWLDTTGNTGLSSEVIGRATLRGDSIPFAFGRSLRNTFVFDRSRRSWQWLIDDESDGKSVPFARVTLTRRATITPDTPASGLDLLREMHDAVAGRWFRTLIFTQKTTTHAADGTEKVATWYESLRHTPAKGAELRIDTGEPTAGNGVLYTADSLWVFRGGKLAVTRAGGNALVPLIQGVYLQPVERTAAELKSTAVDLSRAVVNGSWNDRPVWIAGRTSAADTTSPQFWVDVESRAVVRAIFAPAPGAPVMDIRLEKLVPVSGGWLATHCEFYVNGKLTQQEDYSGWQGNVPLAPELFDPATWSTARHWAHAEPPAR